MREQSTMLLKLDDFAGVIPNRNWTRFDYLLAVAKLALKNQRQDDEEQQRNFHFSRRRFSHFPPTGRRKMGSFRPISNEPSKEIETAEMGKKRNKKGERGRSQETVFGGIGGGGSWRPPLPERFARYIDELGGREVKMVIQKQLTKSDLDQAQSRLAIPRRAVEEDFLTAEEAAALGKRWGTNGRRVSGVDARLIVEPWEKEWVVNLRQWATFGGGGGNYVLTSQWNNVVEEVKLGEDEAIQLWSFRVGGELNLILVRLGL